MDARVERTRTQLMSALTELARERPVGQVSISELCVAAGVSRPTFYQHFATVDDVLTAVLDDRLARVIATPGPEGSPQDLPAAMARFLVELGRDRQAYQVLLSQKALPGGPSETLATWMVGRLREHFGLGPQADLSLTFASAGIVAVVRSWLQESLETSGDVDRLAARLWDMTTSILVRPPEGSDG